MNTPLAKLILSAHLLRYLAQTQHEGRRASLDDVALSLGVDRGWARSGLSRLHFEGLLDVTTMRLSLEGFTFGRALGGVRLAPLPVDHAAAA